MLRFFTRPPMFRILYSIIFLFLTACAFLLQAAPCAARMQDVPPALLRLNIVGDTLAKLYHQAATREGAKDSAGLCTAYLSLGQLYNEISRHDSALYFLDKAMSLAHHQADQPVLLPRLYLLKSSVYRHLGDFNKGTAYAYRALEHINKQPMPPREAGVMRAQAYFLVSVFFTLTRQLDQATAYQKKADSVLVHYPDPLLIANVLLAKGNVVSEQPDGAARGLPYFKAARDYSIRHGLQHIAFAAMVNIGVSYYKTDSFTKAIIVLKEAFALENMYNAYMQLAAYSTIGEIYYTQGDYRNAEQYLRLALKEGVKRNIREIQFYAHEFLYKTYRAQGKYQEALQHYEAYQNFKAEREGKEVHKELSEMELKYKSAEKDKEIITKNLELERQQNKLNTYLFIGAATITALGFLLFFLRNRGIRQTNRIQVLQKEQQINTLRAMIQGSEQERSRIARELHDGIGAMVAAVKMEVGMIQSQHPELHTLTAIDAGLENTSREIRAIAHNLLPTVLLENTLWEALLLYCNSLMMNNALDIEIQYDDQLPDLQDNVKLTVYRIFQELVRNIVRHARATKAYIQVRNRGGLLKIAVEDNGTGFNPDVVKFGLGLNNIRRRVSALEGSLDIHSTAGMGSTFFLTFSEEALKNHHFTI